MRSLFCFLLLAAVSLQADEGMWPFNQFPKEQVKKKYGVEVTDKLLEQLRLASVRMPGGSASFVSPNGLIFTNHHVVLGCVQEVSTKEKDYVANGFVAATQSEELRCPGSEANVLLRIEEITERVRAARKAPEGSAEANRQVLAALSTIENECSSKTGNRCQAVTLYGGARFDLYEYKKYTDIRLVFAPEFNIGFFGGDPDNFTYPRFNLDIGFVRAYENGKPASTPQFLKFSKEGVQDKQVVFVSGNPGSTQRLLTVAEAEYTRDVRFPVTLAKIESAIKALKEYSAKSAENERVAKDMLFGLENSFKAYTGEYQGLRSDALMNEKRRDEQQLRRGIAADPKLNERYAKIFDEISTALETARRTYAARVAFEGGAYSDLFSFARFVYRLPTEKAKPVNERLREYAGSSLASTEHRIYAPKPITPSLEIAEFTDYFEHLQKTFGADYDLVKKILQGRTPAQAAEYYVKNTKLADVAERKRLAASVEAINESKDSMIELMRIIDPAARAVRKRFEDSAEAVLNSAKPKLAAARFAVFGNTEAPDATFTLRLSYGQVKGYENNRGQEVPYATRFSGLYARATNQDPYILPPSWRKAKDKLDLSKPFNFVSTADIIGGNSGSPTVNPKGEIVGIVFDGNIEGLPNNFDYSETQARAVHVASQGILEALRKVYNAETLLTELGM